MGEKPNPISLPLYLRFRSSKLAAEDSQTPMRQNMVNSRVANMPCAFATVATSHDSLSLMQAVAHPGVREWRSRLLMFRIQPFER